MENIIGAALEVFVHEILYVRSLYPRDVFDSTYHIGVNCHACESILKIFRTNFNIHFTID